MAHLGKIVATLDVVSGGRALCGIGAGWFEREHRLYGWEFPPLRERFARLEDALELLPLMWGPGSPRFEGRTVTVEEAICYPRPLQERVPILVGGSGERRTLRLVARHADACNLFGDPETVRHKVAVLRSHCEAEGRDPAEVTVTHLAAARVVADGAAARGAGRRDGRGARRPLPRAGGGRRPDGDRRARRRRRRGVGGAVRRGHRRVPLTSGCGGTHPHATPACAIARVPRICGASTMGTEHTQTSAGRRVAAMVLIALASVLAFLALMAIWVNRQALDTNNWTRASSEMLEQPAVRNLLAARLTDQLYDSVDVEAAVREVLPPRAEALAGPAANALRDQVEKRARRALERPRVQELWADANRVAHQQLIAVIEGGGDTVSTQDGRVVLNVSDLLAQLQQQVGVGGRLRRVLPAGASQITILESDQLGTAQTVARGLRPLPVILIVLSLVVAGIAIAIAPGWRRQVLRAYGIGFVAAGAAALLTRSLAGDMVVDSLARTAAAEPAVAQVWTIGTDLLVDVATATIVYGVVMIVAAWLAGPTRPATLLRRVITPYLREPAIAYGALAVVVAGLIWWAPTPAWRNAVMAGILSRCWRPGSRRCGVRSSASSRMRPARRPCDVGVSASRRSAPPAASARARCGRGPRTVRRRRLAP